MSIINNANPGSVIRLICLIDNVLTKRKGKPISRKDLLDLCRPSNLPDTEGARGRFESNLNFWIKEEFWIEDEQGVRSKDELSSEEDFADRLRDTIVKNALRKDQQNICDGNGIEPFLTSITCLLAQNNYTFLGGDKLVSGSSGNVAQIVNKYLPERLKINLSNDAPTLLEYGYFLGFLEPIDAKNFIVDPTRSIQNVLKNIFAQTNEMKIREFIKQLSTLLPMLDTGVFRQQIEPLMVENGWVQTDSHLISSSLSHSLTRLSNGFNIVLEVSSDDLEGMRIHSNNGSRVVNKVRYVGGTK
ncbi:protein DpdG [Flavobacterium sp.]|uniref:protein DpdG n=1 Tax=Flavobacterium sp. TaxID=239 RepID=UPI0026099744|nr:protein DpdG [Flavobacterium sp.]